MPRFILKGANFSQSGLGSTDWVKSFAQKAQITDNNKILAMKALYDSFESAGLWSKINAIAFFPGSTPETQKYVFSKPALGEPFQEITFTGNGSSVDGWTPALEVYAVLPFNMPAGNVPNLSFGFYNNTAEVAPGAGFGRRGMEMLDNTAPANYSWCLTRYYQDTVISPVGAIGLASASNDKAFPASGSYNMTKTGFLQSVKQGNTLRLLDNGTVIASNTNANQVMTGGGTHKLMLGTGMNADGSAVIANSAKGASLARYTFYYVGQLSLTEVVTFNTIVNTFLTAFGRAAA